MTRLIRKTAERIYKLFLSEEKINELNNQKLLWKHERQTFGDQKGQVSFLINYILIMRIKVSVEMVFL